LYSSLPVRFTLWVKELVEPTEKRTALCEEERRSRARNMRALTADTEMPRDAAVSASDRPAIILISAAALTFNTSGYDLVASATNSR